MSRESSSRCSRNPRCQKPSGHAGWCKTRGDGDDPRDQAELHVAALEDDAQPIGRSRRPTLTNSRADAFKELAAKRREGRGGGGRRAAVEYSDDEEEDDYGDDDDDDDDVRAVGRGGAGSKRKASYSYDDDGAQGGDDSTDQWKRGGPAAPLAELEHMRLPRHLLEKYLLEPFFQRVVVGGLVRYGCGNMPDGQQFYRVAEVRSLSDGAKEQQYMLGAQPTTKLLELSFGEYTQLLPMTAVSNQPFQDSELHNWSQVLEVFDERPVSASQLEVKKKRLREASNYTYTDKDVTRRIEEGKKQAELAGEPIARTARQRMRHAGGELKMEAATKLKNDGFGNMVKAGESKKKY